MDLLMRGIVIVGGNPSGGAMMKYKNVKEDMLAIKQLLDGGMIDMEEAVEMRRYVESLA